MTIQANQGFGVSVFGATSAGGGGSTSPGGSSGQVQYNNGGSFGGMSGTTWTDASQSLAIASTGAGTGVTTSSPVLNLTQTWNAGAVTFTGLKFNATDTASAAGSLLLDIGTGGGSYTSAFNVTKTGGFTFNDTATTTGTTPWRFLAPNLTAPGGATIFVGKDTNTGARLTYDALLSSAVVGVNISGTTAHVTLLAGGTGGFLYLRPGSSGATQLGAADAAAPVAQTFKVQSVVGSTPGASDVAGANFTIQGSAGRGSGAGGSIIFQVAPAGSAGTGAQNAYSTALTINSASQFTFAAGSASSPTLRFSTAGWLSRGGNWAYSDGSNRILEINGGASGGIFVEAAYALGFVNDGSINAPDVFLRRDGAPNTLALRNGTSAQLFRVYSTYNGTNDAYGAIGAGVKLDGTYASGDENILYIGSQKKGSPTALTKLVIQVDGTTRFDYGVTNSGEWYTGSNFKVNGTSWGVTALLVGSSASAIKSSADGVIGVFNNAGTDFSRFQFGGTTSSFPALKRSTTTLQVRLADDSAYAPVEASTVRTATAYTVATLPAAGTAGRRAYVTDATAPTYLGALIGGGTVVCPVFDNGTAWVSA